MSPNLHHPSLRGLPTLAALALLFACAGPLLAAGEGKGDGKGAPVVAGVVEHKAMVEMLSAFGHVEPSHSVEIKSRVDGPIVALHFREGAEVRKGDLLLEIDPRPFDVKVRQAEADLRRDQARLENARQDARRQQDLQRQKLSSQELFDKAKAEMDALEAMMQSDQAALDAARLQREFADLHAPIGGRVGRALVQEGNLVKANGDTPLLVIHQTRPIEVGFTVPERHLQVLRERMAAGRVAVEARIPDDDRPVAGELSFIDHAVDSATATVTLKARFPNEEERLWPGQFVRIGLTLREQPDALVVPTAAVQIGPQGHYLFTLEGEESVKLRIVEVERADERETVLRGGVEAGARIVVDGQSRLTDGAKVKLKEPK